MFVAYLQQSFLKLEKELDFKGRTEQQDIVQRNMVSQLCTQA